MSSDLLKDNKTGFQYFVHRMIRGFRAVGEIMLVVMALLTLTGALVLFVMGMMWLLGPVGMFAISFVVILLTMAWMLG
jgi:hypothetical protein